MFLSTIISKVRNSNDHSSFVYDFYQHVNDHMDEHEDNEVSLYKIQEEIRSLEKDRLSRELFHFLTMV